MKHLSDLVDGLVQKSEGGVSEVVLGSRNTPALGRAAHLTGRIKPPLLIPQIPFRPNEADSYS